MNTSVLASRRAESVSQTLGEGSAALDFSDTEALARLEAMDPEAIDALAFGVIGMTLDGTVVRYNKAECELAGLGSEAVLGHNFFVEVAPCTNNFLVGQRFMDEPELDETLPYVFTVRMQPTKVQLRMLKSEASDRMYLLVNWGR